MNYTITVPAGTTNHGNPNLLCVPPAWNDYLIFFFANYFAHAATVVAVPGQNGRQTLRVLVAALILPVSGVMRATYVLARRPALAGRDAFEVAARAGALVMVVRKPWTRPPRDGEPKDPEARGPIFSLEQRPPRPKCHWWECTSWRWRYPPAGATIHGEYWMRPDSNYELRMVPYKATLRFPKKRPAATVADRLTEQQPPAFASTYNLPKAIASLVQAVWAVVTIYQARGDQIAAYGYAAFGLTVVPYAWVSVVNLAANLVAPDYPALLLVRTPAMDAAEREEGCVFSGALDVALDPADDESALIADDGGFNTSFHIPFWGFVLGLLPLAVVGALSGFHEGSSSTSLQRGFVMAWLVLGICLGPFNVKFIEEVKLAREDESYDWADEKLERFFRRIRDYAWVLLYLVLGVAAIGGMVMVGLMMRDFGTCTLIG